MRFQRRAFPRGGAGDPLREGLRAPRVAPIHDMQRHLHPALVGISRRGVRVVRALRLRGGSLRANDESRCTRTWGRMEVEAVGLDRE